MRLTDSFREQARPCHGADTGALTAARAEDPYTWQALPEKQAPFSKNLSDHSIGAYKKLWAGVGQTFEAVPKHLVADPTHQSCMITVSLQCAGS